jgi:mannose-6-phosphate isomerase-like protein (cupin superfamily)
MTNLAATQSAGPGIAEQPAAVFARDGFLGPIRLFTEAQSRIIAERLRRKDHPAPAEWVKGHAVTDRFWYELATRPLLLSLLRSLLGTDVILWGARLIKRKPGQIHVWHTDIESSAPEGGFVSAWVGIENTSQESALQLVTRSHLFGKTSQQALQEKGFRRGEASLSDVLACAREYDPSAECRQPVMSDGEMLLFDGRLWHGSHNLRTEGQRFALLLQYAAAEKPVRIPDFKQLEWPFRFFDTPLPPAIVVSGASADGVNRVAPPPPPAPEGDFILSSAIHSLPLPLTRRANKRWTAHRIFRGRSTVLDFLNCHASILDPGHSPHPPHAHAEEELLIVLDGEAELVISNSPAPEGARIEPVRPGAFAYYPPFQHHTIRNAGTSPVSYLMFKWRAGALQERPTLATGVFDYGNVQPSPSKRYSTQRLIRGPTPYLSRLGCHLTVLQPEGRYQPHVDDYDVAILLISGEVETLGERVTAPAVIYYAAGEPHGMRNVGDQPARYLVFEFRVSPMDVRESMERRNERTAGHVAASAAEPPAGKRATPASQLARLLQRLFSGHRPRNGSNLNR